MCPPLLTSQKNSLPLREQNHCIHVESDDDEGVIEEDEEEDDEFEPEVSEPDRT